MSDFDRGKFYGKKKFLSPKEGQGNSGYGRGYHGRRSPSGRESASSKYDRDFPPADASSKVKQPTILLKPKEANEDTALSPKKAVQKDTEAQAAISAIVKPQPPPEVEERLMTHSVKFLEDSALYSESLQDYILPDHGDFLVVGVVGPQGSGKSTILNLIAHRTVTEELKKAVFKGYDCPVPRDCGEDMDEEYGHDSSVAPPSEGLGSLNLSDDDKLKYEIFRVQSREDVESNSCATRGIDAFITENRTILLDCQPFSSVSVLDDLLQSDGKRSSSIVSDLAPTENTGEIQGLQLTSFLMSVCHVIIVVQDWFFDSNVVRFIQTAEMLKPTHSNPEDDLLDHFPHLLMVQNKAQMEDFTPQNFRQIHEMYKLLFAKSKFLKDTYLGLSSSRLIGYLNDDTCGDPFNVFLIPEYGPHSNVTYRGHPKLEAFIKKFRANILGSVRPPLTHVQLTEKTWLIYCAKVWENVRKSSFFVEYTKLMP